jgi:hypothetical protein
MYDRALNILIKNENIVKNKTNTKFVILSNE